VGIDPHAGGRWESNTAPHSSIEFAATRMLQHLVFDVHLKAAQEPSFAYKPFTLKRRHSR
jgi:hypothetical protein